MTGGKKNILEWFQDLNKDGSLFVYWSIYYINKTDSGSPIMSVLTEGIHYDQSYDQLRKTLDWLQSGSYTIIANNKVPVTVKGGFRMNFQTSMTDSPATQPTGMAQTISGADVETRVRELVTSELNKKKVEDLEKEVRDLKKELEGVDSAKEARWTTAINALAPALSGLLTRQPAGAIAGMKPAEEVPEASVEERLGNVVRIFAKHDTNWLGTLEKMAAAVEKNPSIIQTLNAFI